MGEREREARQKTNNREEGLLKKLGVWYIA